MSIPITHQNMKVNTKTKELIYITKIIYYQQLLTQQVISYVLKYYIFAHLPIIHPIKEADWYLLDSDPEEQLGLTEIF